MEIRWDVTPLPSRTASGVHWHRRCTHHANASKHRGVRYDRAQVLHEQLQTEIAELLEQAETADADDEPDPQRLPQELKRRQVLKSKLDAACERLEAQAKARAEGERAEYERKVAAREQRKGRSKGKHIKRPKEQPEDSEQSNLTDPDSRLMRKKSTVNTVRLITHRRRWMLMGVNWF